ncbi:NAD(P)H-dependent FMN reductase [Andreprevotia lacus DSM 23236]|jgi:NAD(P)H-dependent FMN reductase|uniref:NAD(P)H-dependent FMN reductase n=1 Tax=Andreprevotia lacus DSM 23236 TaxID=1121001 RepID=A0A1W1XF71_9NEIS|nr:NAD(P)H-dependent oxidoreductase [Andreprevotia lacus]SMC22576.1 NAD(P)H-dependent FMN reductase [Andreprevotia lacus DSM 23236]
MSLLVLSGSIRRASFHTKLAAAAAEELDRQGQTYRVLNLADFPLPLYDGDLEAQGLPASARALRQLFSEYDGFVIANPEYNGSITPLLKNVLDWVSRKDAQSSQYEPYAGKTALLLSTSPGSLAGQRALRHTREILTSLGAFVLPQHVAVPNAAQSFSAEGKLVDEKQLQALSTQLAALGRLTAKLAA